MGIESLGSYYLNEVRSGAGALTTPGINPGAAEGPEPGGAVFSALLDRARAEAAAAEDRTRAGAATREDRVPEGPAPRDGKPRVDKTGKLYEQCEALETFLVKTLITGMRSTVGKSGFLDGGFAGKMYEDMLYDEYAKDFSKNAGFGLAELAYLELTGQRGKIVAGHA